MKFEFEIDDDFEQMIDRESFKEEIKRYAKNSMISCICKRDIEREMNNKTSDFVNELLNEHKSEIIKKAVETLANRLKKNQEIKDLLPSGEEMNETIKKNEEYFMNLINRAIARKFKL